MPDGGYCAFLSYSSSDRARAEWLHSRLERYRTPRRLVGREGRHGRIPRRLGRIFIDREYARPATDLEGFISDELARSQQLIVVCTPESANEQSWVGREIEIFRQRRPDGPIHAVIARGSPPSCFPRQLLTAAASGAIRQPLAADLRSPAEGGDGEKKGLVKLIAGLLGTDPDKLWQKERRRQRLRAAVATAIMLAVIAAASSLFVLQARAREGRLLRTAQQVNRTDEALSDLLVLAAGPPPEGALLGADPVQAARVREIARRYRSGFAGFAARLHDATGKVLGTSRDGRIALTSQNEDPSVYVWNVATWTPTARLPIDAADWFPAAMSQSALVRLPRGLRASPDARMVAAVYAVGPRPQTRQAAIWRLSARGTCDAPCVPERIEFDLAGPGPDPGSLEYVRSASDFAHLFLAADDVLYTEARYVPVRISLTSHTVVSMDNADPAARQARVEKVSPPPPEPTESTNSGGGLLPVMIPPSPPPLSYPAQAAWFEKDGRSLAVVDEGDSALQFFRANHRALRLEFPGNLDCRYSCNVEVVFFDQGRRAFVAEHSGRVDGVVSLEDCSFDEWPAAASLKPDAAAFRAAQGSNRISNVKDFVPSPDDRFVAGVMTLSGRAGYRNVAAIYSIAEKRLTAVFEPSKDAKLNAVRTGTGQAAFLATTDEGVVGLTADGIVAAAAPPESISFRFDERGPTFGDRYRALAVSVDGRHLALAQRNVIFLQQPGPDAVGTATRLSAADVEMLVFSPNGKWLAGSSRPSDRDWTSTSAPSVSLWRVDTGELVGTRTARETSLLGVLDDGALLVEKENTLRLLDARTGDVRALPNSPTGRFVTEPMRDGLAVFDSAKGRLWMLDARGELSKETTSKDLVGRRLTAISPDGRTALSGSAILDVVQRAARLVSVPAEIEDARFGPDGTLAMASDDAGVQTWSSTGAAPLETFKGSWRRLTSPWRALSLVWFSQSGDELWTMDLTGRFHRWSRNRADAADVAAACTGLRLARARLELSDAELKDAGLSASDRVPCLRAGLLSRQYWSDVVRRSVGAITGHTAFVAPSECAAIEDPARKKPCEAYFEARWDRLQALASTAKQ